MGNKVGSLGRPEEQEGSPSADCALSYLPDSRHASRSRSGEVILHMDKNYSQYSVGQARANQASVLLVLCDLI